MWTFFKKLQWTFSCHATDFVAWKPPSTSWTLFFFNYCWRNHLFLHFAYQKTSISKVRKFSWSSVMYTRCSYPYTSWCANPSKCPPSLSCYTEQLIRGAGNTSKTLTSMIICFVIPSRPFVLIEYEKPSPSVVSKILRKDLELLSTLSWGNTCTKLYSPNTKLLILVLFSFSTIMFSRGRVDKSIKLLYHNTLNSTMYFMRFMFPFWAYLASTIWSSVHGWWQRKLNTTMLLGIHENQHLALFFSVIWTYLQINSNYLLLL